MSEFYQMNCKGHNKRIEIVSNYDLVPVNHYKLLNGQEKRSSTGYLLSDRYYLFKYKSKTDKNDSGSFLCGYVAGENFLKLLNHPPIRLFNPLSSVESKNIEKNKNRISAASSEDKKEWDPLNKELYQAVNLLCMFWDVQPYGLFLDMILYLRNNPDKRTQKWAVLKFNEILGKDSFGRTLEEMIIEFKEKGNKLKSFAFPLMR